MDAPWEPNENESFAIGGYSPKLDDQHYRELLTSDYVIRKHLIMEEFISLDAFKGEVDYGKTHDVSENNSLNSDALNNCYLVISRLCNKDEIDMKSLDAKTNMLYFNQFTNDANKSRQPLSSHFSEDLNWYSRYFINLRDMFDYYQQTRNSKILTTKNSMEEVRLPSSFNGNKVSQTKSQNRAIEHLFILIRQLERFRTLMIIERFRDLMIIEAVVKSRMSFQTVAPHHIMMRQQENRKETINFSGPDRLESKLTNKLPLESNTRPSLKSGPPNKSSFKNENLVHSVISTSLPCTNYNML